MVGLGAGVKDIALRAGDSKGATWLGRLSREIRGGDWDQSRGGGRESSMRASGSRSKERSSVGSSEARAKDMRGVGVDGGDGDGSYIGRPGRGGGDGLS